MKEAYPLYWPEGWKRETYRTNNWQFARDGERLGSVAASRDALLNELRRLGATDVIVSSNIPVNRDGMMRGDFRNPTDPGVAVYFTYRKKPMCLACDKFVLVRHNLRAITLTIQAIRGIERWGASDMIERAFKGFTALPEQGSQAWREILEIPPDAKPTEEQIDAAYRMAAHVYHPDKGGTAEEFNRLTIARENAKRDMGYIR